MDSYICTLDFLKLNLNEDGWRPWINLINNSLDLPLPSLFLGAKVMEIVSLKHSLDYLRVYIDDRRGDQALIRKSLQGPCWNVARILTWPILYSRRVRAIFVQHHGWKSCTYVKQLGEINAGFMSCAYRFHAIAWILCDMPCRFYEIRVEILYNMHTDQEQYTWNFLIILFKMVSIVKMIEKNKSWDFFSR